MTRNQRTIKVLIVDDSAVVRQVLSDLLDADPQIEVIGTASDPFIAVQKIGRQRPDVITLDIEMPRMDGLTFLQKIMSQHPIPVVMCSNFTERGTEATFQALRYGAVEVIGKPRLGVKAFFEESRVLICDAVKAAAQARLRPLSATPRHSEKLSADAILAPAGKPRPLSTTEQIVVIGASTGGTEALRRLLEALPADAPGVVIVQHMPPGFTAAFARRLNESCRVAVKEAADGDTVLPGRALIAPGNRHLLLKRSGARYFVAVNDGPLVNRHRPAVDVLFRSAARDAGANAVGVILTGMGNDGAQGMLELKQAGAATIAQDEASCVVFGMPKEAIRLGGIDQVLPLERIASAILQCCRSRQPTDRD